MSELEKALERAFPVYSMGGLSAAMYPADENSEGEGWAVDNDDWKIISAAARKWLADTIECPTCGGKGKKPSIVDGGITSRDLVKCPDCVNGRQPTPDGLERMAKAAAYRYHRISKAGRSYVWGMEPEYSRQRWRKVALAAWLAEHGGQE